MCIVIDTNALSSVFSSGATDHAEFKPVRDWIIEDRGKVVYGGKKYRKELKAARKYYSLLLEFDKARKEVCVCDARVDEEQHRMEQLVGDDKFDDAHLAAIVSVSGCKLVCTKDKSSHHFLGDASLYPRRGLRPRLYSGLRNERLLCNKNIAQCCK